MGCHACLGFSESGGSSTDKALTRNANRITEQQMQYEQDMITPYIVDKSTNQAVVNEEFINLYPSQSAGTFSDEELKSVGQSDLKQAFKSNNKEPENIEYSGDEKQGITDIIEAI